MSELTGHDMVICWTLVQLLTAEEASAVTILSANPDFGAPSYAIEVNAEWTNWIDQRFEGDTIIECLNKANRSRLHSRG